GGGRGQATAQQVAPGEVAHGRYGLLNQKASVWVEATISSSTSPWLASKACCIDSSEQASPSTSPRPAANRNHCEARHARTCALAASFSPSSRTLPKRPLSAASPAPMISPEVSSGCPFSASR